MCDLYEQAGALAEQGVHVVSTDEKTGMQALERLHPDVPMGPGRPQGREYEYVRHGTLCLIANLEVWCGHVIAPSVGPTRAEADFSPANRLFWPIRFLRRNVAWPLQFTALPWSPRRRLVRRSADGSPTTIPGAGSSSSIFRWELFLCC